jgi:hypothetical protein
MSNLPLSEQFRVVAKAWVDADAAANILEDTKSAVLAERMLELGDLPVSKAEMLIKGTPAWRSHVESICEARKKANRLKVQMEYIRMQASEVASFEATKRAEMKL